MTGMPFLRGPTLTTEIAMLAETPVERTIGMMSNGNMIGTVIEIRAGLLVPEAFPIPLLGWWPKVRIPNGTTATNPDHAVTTQMIVESLAKTMTQIVTSAAIQVVKAEVQNQVMKARTRSSAIVGGSAAEMMIATDPRRGTADVILAGVIVQGIGSTIGAVAEVAAGIGGAKTEVATCHRAAVMKAMPVAAAAAALLSFHRRHPAAVSAPLQSERPVDFPACSAIV